jgi:hypothetical protein
MDPSTIGPVVLPVVKFSYAIASAERHSPLGWTHLSGGADLVLIFDHVKTVDARSGLPKDTRYLRVRRGLEMLVRLFKDISPSGT